MTLPNHANSTRSAKGGQAKTGTECNFKQVAMQQLGWDTCALTVPRIWEDVCWMWKDGPLQKGVQK